MRKVPRASLCVTLLNDEDFRILVSNPGGIEAFGVFVAVLILGRERLQQHKAHQIEGTDALILENSLSHIAALTHIPVDRLESCLRVLADVAKDAGGEPWMYRDEKNRLVIRSFFKFNTQSGWGGHRSGSGRAPVRNQDDAHSESRRNQDGPQKNQDDSLVVHLDPSQESSWSLSGSGTGAGSKRDPLPPKDEAPKIQTPAPEPEPIPKAPPDPAAAFPRRPPVENAPAEVRRVGDMAERLFPALDFGPKVHEYSGDYLIAHIEYALKQAHAAGARSWKYVVRVLDRVAADGLPKEKPSKPTPSKDVIPMYQPIEHSDAVRQKYANAKPPAKTAIGG